MKISLEQFTEIVNKKQNFIINYGDGIKEIAYWDEDKQLYGSETGYWGFELLYQIAKGEVENTKIEFMS